jgi:hypothetical protein
MSVTALSAAEEYGAYLERKAQRSDQSGFEPVVIPEKAFDFQKSLIDWAVRKGRSAIFADCGLGKSLMELTFADNVVRKTNGNVLLLTPIAVGTQMVLEAEKFGISAKRSRSGQVHRGITITNYEQLEKFNPSDFQGIVGDESSILKNFDGKTKELLTQFSRKIPYRLLATATAAPNDFIELGTSSEALGYLGHMDMLGKFFINDQNNIATNRRGRFSEATKWRLKGHAHDAFWRWVTSWARAIRSPSDLGFSDDGYHLPEFVENHVEIKDIDRSDQGTLFAMPAVGLKEQRDERKATVEHRCEKAAELALSKDDFSVIWCNLNEEGDLLERLIPGSVQVSGRDSDDSKEEKLVGFTQGKFKYLVIKPKIGAWGLNWQHCARTQFFPTHSYEQYYQAMRRFWRFGQNRTVVADIVYTDGDAAMIGNLARKQRQAEEMFKRLVAEMNNSLSVRKNTTFGNAMEVPSWL